MIAVLGAALNIAAARKLFGSTGCFYAGTNVHEILPPHDSAIAAMMSVPVGRSEDADSQAGWWLIAAIGGLVAVAILERERRRMATSTSNDPAAEQAIDNVFADGFRLDDPMGAPECDSRPGKLEGAIA